MPANAHEIIAEVEGAVRDAPVRRAEILRQVAGLFLADADRLSARQIAVFDDILLCLLEQVEAGTLAQLSNLMASVPSAPKKVTRRLACHEDASVAAPVLQSAGTLPDADLIEIARSGSPLHRLAIASRTELASTVTDTLLHRAETDVLLTLAGNPGARFSTSGHATLAALAAQDEEMADAIAGRSDMPTAVVQRLQPNASDTPAPAIDYSEAKSLVLALNNDGKLADQAVNRFAVRQERENLAAALSLLATVAIETIAQLFDQSDGYGLMIACRASRLNWTTTQAVLLHRKNAPRLSPQEVGRRRDAFEALPLSIAQWTIRFDSSADFAAKLGLPQASS